MDDNTIITLYNDRDERAIAETERKYGRFCMTVAQNILASREDSEECVNDTWLKTWNAIPPQNPSCLRAFLGRITRNLALDRYRRNAAQKRNSELTVALEELDGCLSGGATPEEESALRALGESINRFLTTLTVRDRDVFLCRYYYTYPIRQIAERHRMRENYLRNLLSRTVRKLREHLEKEGFAV